MEDVTRADIEYRVDSVVEIQTMVWRSEITNTCVCFPTDCGSGGFGCRQSPMCYSSALHTVMN